MWLYPTDFSVRRNPINKAYGGEFTITQETNGRLTYYYGTAGSNTTPYQSFQTTSTIPLNTWTHVALVRDLTNMQLRWYINGVLDGSIAATYSSATASTNHVSIGSGYANYYKGKIDEIGIYNTALTQSQITERYQAGLNPYRDIKDSSGVNHGISSSPVSGEGKIGRGMYLNGIDDLITIPNSPSLNPSIISLEAWIKPTVIKTGNFISKGGNSGYRFRVVGDGTIQFLDRGGTNSIRSNRKINTNEWIHVAVTGDSSGLKLYINGVLDNSNATPYGGPVTTDDLFLGQYSYGIELYAGYLDEVRISNLVRTPQAIRESYEIGLRSHDIIVDFSASLNISNLISGSNDLSFTLDGKSKGMLEHGSNLYSGDKLIVREVVGGVEYLSQGNVKSVNVVTGAVEVYGWDSMSTFPIGGYSSKADVFKWQREYMQTSGRTIPNILESINLLTFKLTNTYGGRNIWIDDVRVSDGYISTSPYSLTLPREYNYIQYKAIETTTDNLFTPYLNQVQIDYTDRTPKLNEIMRHGKWFVTDEKQPFWWVGK